MIDAKLNNKISRREFLKTTSLTGSMALFPFHKPQSFQEQNWPEDQLLGRNCTGGMINLRRQPSADAEIIQQLYEDTVVIWEKEVVGESPAGLVSARWVLTPEGYVYAPALQPVWNHPNTPLTDLPSSSQGNGIWVEVTVPFIDFTMANPPARSPWLAAGVRPRLYYSQVMWVDGIQTDSSGQPMYHVNELYGSYGDIFWAPAYAFRQITSEEITPITPDVSEKHIYVDVNHQTVRCYEGNSEVYYCRASTGARFNAAGEAVEEWSTPIGPHPIYRKLISIHMSGGSTGAGWDTPGIGWTSFFAQGGVAIHSTFWHNNFGVPVSHGCVNVTPDDAKWIFRWTQPQAMYDPGDITVGMPGGTTVEVVEG